MPSFAVIPETEFNLLMQQIRACRLCAQALPLPPKPILQAHPAARILIAGQAPGLKAHTLGRPFDDPSGDRLRQWLGVDRTQFYDEHLFAIVPMGFCFPGSHTSEGKKRGDKAPRPECAQTWHERLLAALPNIELTLVLGQYAIDYHLGGGAGVKGKLSVGQAVANWQAYWPEKMVLPHPSPRNNLWLKRHPQFETELLPKLRARIAALLER
ncbi:uracil-DNA glycosylase family protein [Shewanella sp. SHSM-M6]|uniref:Uracil-DNA glycosylase family protein n=2 Tax=Shewanella salipaludis TaxID=2723052 RepID=A0A972JJV2_9GAMM|nr:uracil-DNA glycosylase family protein [Shewanella salipaludis]